MEILKFENSPRPARKKSSSSKIILGFASVAAVAMLGSTLAASISLNGDTEIEFGQGVAVTDACDSSITLTPLTTFDTSANIFKLTSVEISGVDDPSCTDKLFEVKGYDGSSSSPNFEFSFIYNAATTVSRESVGNGAGAISVVSDVATFTPTSGIDISPDPDEERTGVIDIAKFTLETSNAPA